MFDARLTDVMVTQVITVNLHDTVAVVEEKMRVNRIRHIPVLDDNQRLVGMVTYRDLLSFAHPKRTEEGWVFDRSEMNQFILKHIMTKEPVTLKPSDTVARAVEIMATEKYGCIPVVDDNKQLCGIVTQIDILKWLGKKISKGLIS